MDERLFSENLCYFFWDLIHSQQGGVQDIESIFQPPPPLTHHVVFVGYILICAIGLIGNALVIYVTGFVMKSHKCKIWFLNLAVADLIYLLCMPLTIAAEFTGNWIFGLALCKTHNFLATCNNYASVFIITALNIERVLSVAKPIWHLRFFSRRICFWICSIIWSVTVIFSFPVIFFSSISTDDDGKRVCDWFGFRSSQINISEEEDYGAYEENTTVIFIPSNENGGFPHIREQCKYSDCCLDAEMIAMWSHMIFVAKTVMIPMLLFGCIIPLCIIVFSNVTIAIKVSKSQTLKPPRLYKIVITVVLVYFLTWIPCAIGLNLAIIAVFTMDFSLFTKIHVYLPLLGMISDISSCLNPLIYALVGQKVRNLLMCSKRKKTREDFK
ncbi:chemokine-like receptor 1 [Xenopus tropicalis]|uniref:Chemokine-like receptor 1 n=1 Tax=Xenopus tropicalis TaxID=8364 RepID=A0A8J1IZ87_XENTR|nr:chemokine-like receptor 1 [Xenopus tropicalis]